MRFSAAMCILLASVLWGTVGVCSQALYQSNPSNPLSVAFLRLAIATPLFGWMAWRQLGWAWSAQSKDWALMALMGLMQALYQGAFFAAVGYVGVTVATLVTLCSAPLLVALLAYALGRESLSLNTLAAMALALLGTFLLANQPSQGEVRWLGIALSVASALGYAVFTLAGRQLASTYSGLQINAVAFGSGALALGLLAWFTGLQLSYNLTGWALLLYLGLIPTALGYSLFLQGIKHTPATTASILTLAEPLTASLLAWVLLGERLGPSGLLGGLLLLLALGVLLRRA